MTDAGAALTARYAPLDDALRGLGLGHWLPEVPEAVTAALAPGRHGDLPRWQAALADLDALDARVTDVDLAAPAVTLRGAADRDALTAALQALKPWRKGPFDLFGVQVDAEWRSDLKMARLLAAGLPLEGARVLDVGCGNGYYGWRLLGAGARAVIGVDPTLVHVMQYAALRQWLPDAPLWVLPLPFEALPPGDGEFDLVMSMGVLYHRRSPLDHLADLRRCVAPGGHLALETLVVEGDEHSVLCPPDRYARMRNVWFLPSPLLLTRWLERMGFEAVTVTDLSPTTVEEQRSTDWMNFESLREALDPDDPGRTVEGHPAPLRALVTARRPG